MREGLRECYRLASVRPSPYGRGAILTDKHHIPESAFNIAKANPPGAF
jgi:hypothetical protein